MVQVLAEVTSTVALGDVRHDRNGGALHLGGKTEQLMLRERLRRAIDLVDQIHRRLPHPKLPKPLHRHRGSLPDTQPLTPNTYNPSPTPKKSESTYVSGRNSARSVAF